MPIRSFTPLRTALLAPEMPLGRFDAHVAEQKLDLLQLATGLMTKERARSAQVVWGNAGPNNLLQKA